MRFFCPVCGGGDPIPKWKSFSAWEKGEEGVGPELLTLAEFHEGTDSGFLTDRDGTAIWATSTCRMDGPKVFGYYGEVLTPPSTVITHVLWFNK